MHSLFQLVELVGQRQGLGAPVERRQAQPVADAQPLDLCRALVALALQLLDLLCGGQRQEDGIGLGGSCNVSSECPTSLASSLKPHEATCLFRHLEHGRRLGPELAHLHVLVVDLALEVADHLARRAGGAGRDAGSFLVVAQ